MDWSLWQTNSFFRGNRSFLITGGDLFHVFSSLRDLAQKGDGVTRGLLRSGGVHGKIDRPHLHWAIKIDGARVDPLSLLDLAKHYRE
jgi:hypothetical protein